MTKLSRRNFLKGAGLAVAGAAAAGALAGCSSSQPKTAVGLPESWDEEADIVIVGYGGAGVVASITALDNGCSCIVLEKAPGPEGGNTGVSGGAMHSQLRCPDMEDFYKKAIYGSFGTTDEAVLRAMCDNMQETPQWLEDHDFAITWSEVKITKRRPAGYEGKATKADGKGGDGVDLFAMFHGKAVEMGVDVRFSTPAVELFQDAETKEIKGVQAQKEDGTLVNFKAKKAVIMACGGFENNVDMQGQYSLPGIRLWPWGTPYNTGDGFKMCGKIGADMWHMHAVEWASVNYRLPTEEVGTAVMQTATAPDPYNWIYVNYDGKRFCCDTTSLSHNGNHKPVTDYDHTNQYFKNMPWFMVFDQTVFDANRLWIGTTRKNTVAGYAGVMGLCKEWAEQGNQYALDKGWIVKADTIEELAAKMSGVDPSGQTRTVDPAGLAETVAAWNAWIENAGEDDVDPQFGRKAAESAPIATGPFYAIEMGLSCINTQGGPRHNADHQTLGYDGEPIPRLYNVGEFGSVNGFIYVNGNVSEAVTSGRVAVNHAATLTAWDAE